MPRPLTNANELITMNLQSVLAGDRAGNTEPCGRRGQLGNPELRA